MTAIRTFIAIELTEDALQAFIRFQSKLKTLLPPRAVRWSAPQNVHLTLHFLGEASPAEVEQVGTLLKQVAAKTSPFALQMGGLGCFPNFRRPRVLWVGLTEQSPPLQTLHHQVGRVLATAINYSPEQRPYTPHLTLGRTKKGIPSRHLRQMREVIEQESPKTGRLATVEVQSICLLKSELKPTGAMYTRLQQAQFSHS